MNDDSKLIEQIELEDAQADMVQIRKDADGTYFATPFYQRGEDWMDEMPAWYAMEHDDKAKAEVEAKSTVVGDIQFARNFVDSEDIDPI